MADKISITICGDGGCGKSAITLRLVRSQWTEEYDPTIEDSYSVTRNVDGLNYYLSLTDTAGQEEYRGLWASTNLQSDAFLLVYDITVPSTLQGLNWFLEMIEIEAENRDEENNRLLKEKGNQVRGDRDAGWRVPPVMIIAGNKCDLKDARAVTSKVGWEWAKSKNCGFMETSAKEMVNIEETFALIVRRVAEARNNAEFPPQEPIPPQRKGHAPQASGGGYSAYTGRDDSNPTPTSANEKANYDRSKRQTPWWKKLFCMR